MEYKRSESFRHTLLVPEDVQYSLVAEDNIALTRVGKIVDISPRGINFIAADQLTEKDLENPVSFIFSLYEAKIQVNGRIKWRKFHHAGFQYGVEFQATEQLEKLIIEELKLRRKKEVQEGKR